MQQLSKFFYIFNINEKTKINYEFTTYHLPLTLICLFLFVECSTDIDTIAKNPEEENQISFVESRAGTCDVEVNWNINQIQAPFLPCSGLNVTVGELSFGCDCEPLNQEFDLVVSASIPNVIGGSKTELWAVDNFLNGGSFYPVVNLVSRFGDIVVEEAPNNSFNIIPTIPFGGNVTISICLDNGIDIYCPSDGPCGDTQEAAHICLDEMVETCISAIISCN